MRWDAAMIRMLQEAAARSAEEAVMAPEFTAKLVDRIASNVTNTLVNHPATEEFIRVEVERAAAKLAGNAALSGLPTPQPPSQQDVEGFILAESDRAAREIVGATPPPQLDLAALVPSIKSLAVFLVKLGVGAFVVVSFVRWLTAPRER